jgi:hypothetical protein
MTARVDDTHAVMAWVAHWQATDEVIPDGIARTVVAWWHSAGDPGMSGLSHTGTIDMDLLLPEIERDAAAASTPPADRDALAALAAYVHEHGQRDPIPGWDAVWADKLPAPPVDGLGVSAATFLAELFQYERCECCGGDADAHRAGPDPLGFWHAWCRNAEAES